MAQLGIPKNNTVLRPTQADFDSAAFKVIVREPKFTKGGLPKGTIFDGTAGGNLEIKGGASMLDSSYQFRLQTYRFFENEHALYDRNNPPDQSGFPELVGSIGASVARPK
ncbi:MAG: hypothetical protein E2576_07190 [Alcaligenaceae bacterium]|nr:hypothetical protein [Alcaligenaceae bacterium SAGV5]MPS50288.1 hypothetical protein [Alcaligenaceae bacterium SAGV3]MPT56497.1 hypothetical protein [Alcaligenaceae bacterium]